MARKSLFAEDKAPIQTPRFDIDAFRERILEKENREAREYTRGHVLGRDAWLQMKDKLRFANPGTAWATRILERQKAGEDMPTISIEMARRALGINRWEEQDC